MMKEKELNKLYEEMAQFYIDHQLLTKERLNIIHKGMKYYSPEELGKMSDKEFAALLKVSERDGKGIRRFLDSYGFFQEEDALRILSREDFKADFAILFDQNELYGTTFEYLHNATLCDMSTVYKSTFYSLFCILREPETFKDYFPETAMDVFCCYCFIVGILRQKTNVVYMARDLSDVLEYYMMERSLKASWMEEHESEEGFREEILKMMNGGINLPFKAESISSAYHRWYEYEMTIPLTKALEKVASALREEEISTVILDQYFELNVIRRTFHVVGNAALLFVMMVNQHDFNHIYLCDLKKQIHGSTLKVLCLLEHVKELIQLGYIEEHTDGKELYYSVSKDVYKAIIDSPSNQKLN